MLFQNNTPATEERRETRGVAILTYAVRTHVDRRHSVQWGSTAELTENQCDEGLLLIATTYLDPRGPVDRLRSRIQNQLRSIDPRHLLDKIVI